MLALTLVWLWINCSKPISFHTPFYFVSFASIYAIYNTCVKNNDVMEL